MLESVGSEYYAYFTVAGARVDSPELDEIARDAGAGELPIESGTQVVARLDPESNVRQGQPLELWFNAEKLHLFDADRGHSLLAPVVT